MRILLKYDSEKLKIVTIFGVKEATRNENRFKIVILRFRNMNDDTACSDDVLTA